MKRYLAAFFLLPLLTSPSVNAEMASCSFNASKICTLYKDILNDISPEGLKYYGPTNYDHRISGEINVFDASLVQEYKDDNNLPGQLKLTAVFVKKGFFKSGEIMTRINLEKPPYNAPEKIHPFTTNDMTHGYIEVRLKLPKCEQSTDGLCQTNTAPESYQRGLWPSIWMLPTNDVNWPNNGEIDIFEAYKNSIPAPQRYRETTATLHFNGKGPGCGDGGGNGDCKFIGYHLPSSFSDSPFFEEFHTWGFEWEPDPTSKTGGMLMTAYFDNNKAWGPLPTDTLPADGPNAFRRGFHDPMGGFYLITALAVGGGYAKDPAPELLKASMYIQSIKAYSVSDKQSPSDTCKAPVNINYKVNSKKSVTLTWNNPTKSDKVLRFQINRPLEKVLWVSLDNKMTTFTDTTLPGTAGEFVYYLYSQCDTGVSTGVKRTVIIK